MAQETLEKTSSGETTPKHQETTPKHEDKKPDETPDKKQNEQVDAAAEEWKNEQQQKAKLAKEDENGKKKYLNVLLSHVDEDIKNKTHFNREKDLKITCFFAPKFTKTEELYKKDFCINIPYDTIHEIVLEDNLDSIGLSGYVIVNDDGNTLEGVFERHNNFYFVINITEYIGNSSLKYEPYIFDVASVENITKAFKKDKRVKIHLVDIITSILKSHSIASFIKFEKSNRQNFEYKNYKELFSSIVKYVKTFIKINNDNVYEFKKDILYNDNMKFGGDQILNGNDTDLALQHLIKYSFQKVDKNASIYEALQVLLRDCVTSIKMTTEIKHMFETIGDVLIPFFFKEEYADSAAIYYNLWNETSDENNDRLPSEDEQEGGDAAPQQQQQKPQATPAPQTLDSRDTQNNQPNQGTQGTQGTQPVQTTPATKATETPTTNNTNEKMKDVGIKNYGGQSDILWLRHITMRDFFMPFYLCFSYDKHGGPFIWEDINDGPTTISTLNGKNTDNLQSLLFKSIDKSAVDKRWKNAVFIEASKSGTTSTLIFFDWFYRFFLRVFLNSAKQGGKHAFISNVIPDFYLFSLINEVGYAPHAPSNSSYFDNMFDEYNSYTVTLHCGDSVNESLREMGKNLASLVLLNDSYTFTLKGNMLRRPNEIIRLNLQDVTSGGESQLNAFTNLKNNSSLFVYIRKVVHVFKGTEYINNIVASKICEQY